jgi:hypothetical protein
MSAVILGKWKRKRTCLILGQLSECLTKIQDMLLTHDNRLHCWPRPVSLVRLSGENKLQFRELNLNQKLDDRLKKLIKIIEYMT